MSINRIGVIGDIHAESVRLRNVLSLMCSMELDLILCTGDIVDGAGDVNACCELLMENNVQTVLGNHDAWFLKNSMRDLPEATPFSALSESNRQFISNLPVEREYETIAGVLLLCHGLGRHLMAKVRDDDYGYALENNFELQDLMNSRRYRYVINGHTHYRMARDFGGLTVINAGALLYDDPGFLIVDFSDHAARYYDALGENLNLISEKLI